MSKNFNLPNLIGKVVLIECNNKKNYKIIEDNYRFLGAVVSNIDNINDKNFVTPDICVVSTVQGNYQHVQSSEFSYDKVQEIMDEMKKNRKGHMILITNGLGQRIMTSKFPKESGLQAGIIHWWNVISSNLAEEGISSNIISLGYAPFFSQRMEEKNEEELSKMLLIKRFATNEDLRDALLLLSSDDSKYMVGQVIEIDGGLQVHPIKELKGEEISKSENTYDLTGKTAMVIGCSSGMGRETAIELAKRGANIVLMARNEKKLKEIANIIEEIGRTVLIKPVDVTSTEELKVAINHSWDSVGNINILIYCTGCFETELLFKCNRKWEKVMKTNFYGYVVAVMEFIKLCIKNNVSGTIVGVSSVGAMDIPVINSEAYIASKAAMLKFSSSIAESYCRNNIRINCVAPGCIKTPMISLVTDEYIKCWLDNIPMKRIGEPDDISKVIAYLASSASSYVTGSVLAVDGGFLLGKLNIFLDKTCK